MVAKNNGMRRSIRKEGVLKAGQLLVFDKNVNIIPDKVCNNAQAKNSK